MTALSPHELPVSNTARLTLLQKRIGWLCQTARLLAAAYALWTLYLVMTHWLSSAGPYQFAGTTSQFCGLALNLFVWALVAAACYSAWATFSAYLKGQVFSVAAAILLRRTALFGLAAIGADIILRPLSIYLRRGEFAPIEGSGFFYFSPHDLVLLLFLISLFAIAHIFKVAAELADENNSIL